MDIMNSNSILRSFVFQLTTADLAVYNLLTQFNKIQDHSAKLKAHFEMVGKRKNIKEYVAKRPQTEL